MIDLHVSRIHSEKRIGKLHRIHLLYSDSFIKRAGHPGPVTCHRTTHVFYALGWDKLTVIVASTIGIAAMIIVRIVVVALVVIRITVIAVVTV
jgi:hypothetical protein